MLSSPTISGYILRQYLIWFGIMFATILTVIGLIDAVELLRRGSGKPDATASIITGMALLRAPFLAQEAVPFAVMFGGILTFLKMTRNHELVVVRAAGVSVWQFLAPPLAASVLIGVISVTDPQPALRGDAVAVRGAGRPIHSPDNPHFWPCLRRASGSVRPVWTAKARPWSMPPACPTGRVATSEK